VKAAPVEKPAPPPVASKPESEMTPRERLNAEIARSMQTSPASAKKSKPPATGLKGSGELRPAEPQALSGRRATHGPLESTKLQDSASVRRK